MYADMAIFHGLQWFGLVCSATVNTKILFVRDYARLGQCLLINMCKHDITLSMALLIRTVHIVNASG